MCDFIVDSYKNNVEPYLIWEQIDNDYNVDEYVFKGLFNNFPNFKYDYDCYMNEKYKLNTFYSNFDEWYNGEFVEDNSIMNIIVNVLELIESEEYSFESDSYDSESD